LLLASFSFALAASPLRFATVAVIGSGWLLSSNIIVPMLGTPAGRWSAADGFVGLPLVSFRLDEYRSGLRAAKARAAKWGK